MSSFLATKMWQLKSCPKSRVLLRKPIDTIEFITSSLASNVKRSELKALILLEGGQHFLPKVFYAKFRLIVRPKPTWKKYDDIPKKHIAALDS